MSGLDQEHKDCTCEWTLHNTVDTKNQTTEDKKHSQCLVFWFVILDLTCDTILADDRAEILLLGSLRYIFGGKGVSVSLGS